jgi:NNP family nitrate/nitrite transporter-like MFS transporter
VGTIPLGLAPLVHNATGLYVSRFFIGILGGAFVPCQVWTMGFFDNNIVGTANALTGGFGTAGGGITYLIMPAVYDALIGAGHTSGEAWRLTFLVPLAMVITTGIALIVLCPDTPTGKWADRHLHNLDSGANTDTEKASLTDIPGHITDRPTYPALPTLPSREKSPCIPITLDLNPSPNPSTPQTPTKPSLPKTTTPPSMRHITLSPQTAFHILTYMCTFGSELAINSVLASYYAKNIPRLSQTDAANLAAMFGFLDFVTRPLGGVISDLLYKYFGKGGEGEGGEAAGLWWKKGWISVCGVVAGAVLVVIGRVDSEEVGVMVGLVAVMAVFLQAGNGANFSLVPHVWPEANGVLSGLTGAGGNLGGVVFAVVFRFMGGGTDYAKGFWVIGVVNLVVGLGVCWVPPLPKGRR